MRWRLEFFGTAGSNNTKKNNTMTNIWIWEDSYIEHKRKTPISGNCWYKTIMDTMFLALP